MKTMMNALWVGVLAVLGASAVQAQDNIVKFGVSRYDTSSSTSGLSTSPPVPGLAGSDAETGDATTVVLVLERSLTPNLGAELVLGVPPRIKAEAQGPLSGLLALSGLSNEVLSARIVTPTLVLNYYFGDPSALWRPYVGAGINYTRFSRVKSSLLTTRLEMSDSWGGMVQAGVNYAPSKDWGLFASVARVDVKSDVTAVTSALGGSVPVTVTTTVDFKPTTYTAGVYRRF